MDIEYDIDYILVGGQVKTDGFWDWILNLIN
jgi:hypothetical protein